MVVEQGTNHQSQPLVLLRRVVLGSSLGEDEEFVAHAPCLEEGEAREADLSARRLLLSVFGQLQDLLPLAVLGRMFHL